MNNPDNNIRNKVNAMEKRESLLAKLEKNKKIIAEQNKNKISKSNKKSDPEDTTEQTIKVTM